MEIKFHQNFIKISESEFEHLEQILLLILYKTEGKYDPSGK